MKKTLGEKIDYFFNKVIPKKLLVVGIATMIVMKEIQVPREYWWILLAYFGINIGGTIAHNLKKPEEK